MNGQIAPSRSKDINNSSPQLKEQPLFCNFSTYPIYLSIVGDLLLLPFESSRYYESTVDHLFFCKRILSTGVLMMSLLANIMTFKKIVLDCTHSYTNERFVPDTLKKNKTDIESRNIRMQADQFP